MADCKHTVVERDGDYMAWRCATCADSFFHYAEMEQLEAETNGALDMATALFANVIRALYRTEGKEPPTMDTGEQPEPEPTACETLGHDWWAGRCQRCGSSQYLGGK